MEFPTLPEVGIDGRTVAIDSQDIIPRTILTIFLYPPNIGGANRR